MLIVRTGQNEGAAYNGNGTNLTESPTGHANFNVGSYWYDFAGLLGAGRFYSGEFTIILADGTKSEPQSDQDSDDGFDGFDTDEEGLEDEDDASLVRQDHTTVVTNISISLRCGFPSYSDAVVYNTVYDEDTGATNGVIDSELMDLDTWLDAQSTTPAEVTLDADHWWVLRAYLRWSMHWAIYKVKVARPGGEGLADDVAQSELGPGGTMSILEDNDTYNLAPMYGPAGYLKATGADDIGEAEMAFEWHEAKWVRLWELELPMRYEFRGDIGGLPYAAPTTQYNNANIAAPWQGVEMDPLDADATATGTQEDTPDVRSNGREFLLNIRKRCNIHVGPDEVLLFQMQSGRARLMEPTLTVSGGIEAYTPGLVIAGSDTPAFGPKFTLHHLRAFCRARHLKRR